MSGSTEQAAPQVASNGQAQLPKAPTGIRGLLERQRQSVEAQVAVLWREFEDESKAVNRLLTRGATGREEGVVDLNQEPALAIQHHVLATPTLTKDHPPPARMLVGDMSHHPRVLIALDASLAAKPTAEADDAGSP